MNTFFCRRGSTAPKPPAAYLTLEQYREIVSRTRETRNLIVRTMPAMSRDEFQSLYPGKDLPAGWESRQPVFGAFLDASGEAEPLFTWEDTAQLQSEITALQTEGKIQEFLSHLPRRNSHGEGKKQSTPLA